MPRRLLMGSLLGLVCLAAPCLAEDATLPAGDAPIPLPRPTTVAPRSAAQASRTMPAWVQVRLPDGRPAWAPTSSMLITSWQPQPPERVVETARRLMGVPYRWGGETPNGMDCSGFVEEVFRLCGHRLPRLADAQFAACAEVISTDMQAGDLVFFSTYLPGPSHVGIYTGDGRFIHASSSRGVTVSSLDETYYAARYLGARRPPAWLTPAPPLVTTPGRVTAGTDAEAPAGPAPSPTPQ